MWGKDVCVCVCVLCSQGMETHHAQLEGADIKQFSESVLPQENVYQAVYLSSCDLSWRRCVDPE